MSFEEEAWTRLSSSRQRAFECPPQRNRKTGIPPKDVNGLFYEEGEEVPLERHVLPGDPKTKHELVKARLKELLTYLDCEVDGDGDGNHLNGERNNWTQYHQMLQDPIPELVYYLGKSCNSCHAGDRGAIFEDEGSEERAKRERIWHKVLCYRKMILDEEQRERNEKSENSSGSQESITEKARSCRPPRGCFPYPTGTYEEESQQEQNWKQLACSRKETIQNEESIARSQQDDEQIEERSDQAQYILSSPPKIQRTIQREKQERAWKKLLCYNRILSTNSNRNQPNLEDTIDWAPPDVTSPIVYQPVSSSSSRSQKKPMIFQAADQEDPSPPRYQSRQARRIQEFRQAPQACPPPSLDSNLEGALPWWAAQEKEILPPTSAVELRNRLAKYK